MLTIIRPSSADGDTGWLRAGAERYCSAVASRCHDSTILTRLNERDDAKILATPVWRELHVGGRGDDPITPADFSQRTTPECFSVRFAFSPRGTSMTR